MKTPVKRITLDIPVELLAGVDRRAASQRRSRNQFLVMLIEENVNDLNKSGFRQRQPGEVWPDGRPPDSEFNTPNNKAYLETVGQAIIDKGLARVKAQPPPKIVPRRLG